jgi:hypothetical protein
MYTFTTNSSVTARIRVARREWTNNGDCRHCHHINDKGHYKVEKEW